MESRRKNTGPRPISEKDRAYLHDLKTFLEGGKDWREWRSWWEANRDEVRQHERRVSFDLVEKHPLMAACFVLRATTRVRESGIEARSFAWRRVGDEAGERSRGPTRAAVACPGT